MLRAFVLLALVSLALPAVAKSKKRPPPAEDQAAAARLLAQEHRERGIADVAQGKDDEAVRELSAAIEADPSDEVAQHELGKVFFKKGQLAAAIARFDAAVKLDAKDALAWYNLAYASRKSQQYVQAADAYRRYIELAPDDPDGVYGYAEALRLGGNAKEAVAAYQAYLVKETRPAEQKYVARAKERIAELEGGAAAPNGGAAPDANGSARSAQGSAGTPGATGTSTAASAGTRTVVHGADEKPAGTVVVVRTGGEAAGPADAAAAKIAEGDRSLAAKDFRAALFAYQDAILADGKSVPAHVKAGEAYARLGHDDEAIEQWQRALSLEPNNVAAQQQLAEAYARKAALNKPATTTVTVVTPAPAASQVATGATQQGASAPSAQGASTPAAQRAPTRVVAATAPAPSQPAPSQPAPSQPAPSQPAPSQPAPAQPAPAQPASAQAAAVPRRVDEAGARAHYIAGVGLINERRYEPALAELDQALLLNPGYIVAMIARGSARIGLGRYQDAVADYSAAHAADPSLARPLFGLAEAYRAMGQGARAAELYRQFAASTSPDAQANLKQYALDTAQALSPR